MRPFLAALVALAVLTMGCEPVDPMLDPPVDHVTSRTEPEETSETGPAPGRLRPAWQREFSATRKDEVAFAHVAGQVLAWTRRGVEVLDARTGRPRWHYRELEARLVGLTTTPDAVVVQTTERIVGLDAVTGKQLWRTTPSGLGARTLVGSKSGTTVLTWGADAGTVFEAVDAKTGRRRWSTKVEPERAMTGTGCKAEPVPTDGSLFLVKEECGTPKRRFVALDPRTGDVRWQRRTPAEDVWVQEGITLIPEGESRGRFTLLGPGGREILGMSPKRTCWECELAVVGRRAVVPLTGGESLAFIDLRTGKVVREVRHHATGRLTVAGDRVYQSDARLASGYAIPATGLSVIVPRTAQVTTEVAPFGDPEFWDAPAAEPGVFATAGLLFRPTRGERGGTRLTAYEWDAEPGAGGAPVGLGGVRPSEWPQACTLVAEPSWRPGKPVEIGPVTLHGLTCESPRDTGRRIAVSWVARSAREADELLAAFTPDVRAVPGLGDEAYQFGKPGKERTVVRVGRYIITVAGAAGFNGDRIGRAVRALRAGDAPPAGGASAGPGGGPLGVMSELFP
ncbi:MULTISPECIES: PQQ-binding-like beta-propeller repeat protein [Thermomonosporaceae]|uniref:outer membrane protein assembly factor BamB family protein n=1 Tax=Thermomonosporaceae TaxID=2012 RepID=UPI00255B1F15|nr:MULTISPECIES: PQQ-binding-like beta-propeller repeat protein [Thermomonosporaceae]MDL4776179.1 PQQ-binding-like beta-propeller repeat protein [Actinomadura xylanilytica]